jgi:hypothetical protein
VFNDLSSIQTPLFQRAIIIPFIFFIRETDAEKDKKILKEPKRSSYVILITKSFR